MSAGRQAAFRLRSVSADNCLRRNQFSCESEGECTSESARGQFSIFGAIEEKGVRQISEKDAGQEKSFGLRDARGRVALRCGGMGRRNLDGEWEDFSQGLHRKCRKAGRQWAVDSGQ